MLGNAIAEIRERVILVRSSITFNLQVETMYWTDLWGNFLSTIFYTLATVVFFDIIYSNVTYFATYSRAEMFFYLFIGQFVFYTLWGVSYTAIDSLVDDVRSGDLDLVLLKPIPVLFYIETRRIYIIRTLRDAIPPMVVLAFVVPWHELQFSLITVLSGIPVFIMGMICLHIFMLIFSLPVFWVGESRSIFNLAWTGYTFTDGRIPYEGFGSLLKVAFTIVFPILWATGVTVSVMLGKSDPLLMISVCAAVTVIFVWIRSWLWKKALRNYSSASS
jgi:ABC-2 type transport system permease protein